MVGSGRLPSSGRVERPPGCQAEVEDLDPSVPCHEEVLGLQVAVDDPFLVRRGEAPGDLRGEVDRLACRQRPGDEPFAESLAFEELRHEVRRPLHGPDVMDREDVGVVQPSRRLSLLLEAAHPLGVARERLRQYLDGDVTLQPLVARPVDLSHSSRPERREDFVRTEPCSGGKGHPGRRRF
jgi:hypothetical protein